MVLNKKAQERIKAIGIKQRWLADRLGIHEVALTNILAGRRSVSEDLADRIAYEIRIATDEIVESEGMAVNA